MSPTLLTAWPSMPVGAYVRPRARQLPFPLAEPGCTLYARSRQALFHGVRGLGLSPGHRALVPAYHHGSEVEAFERAGLSCVFYAGTSGLAPDEDELESLIDPRVRALHLIHHLGFPEDAARWRAWCDLHDLLLIEDAAPAWLSVRGDRPVGSFGDLAFFSLYKTAPVPDGSAAVSRSALAQPRRRRPPDLRGLARRHGAGLLQRSAALSAIAVRVQRDRPGFDAGRAFDLGDPEEPASAPTALLLPRLALGEIAEARRRNYRRLLEPLRELVPAPFDRLADGACPWLFPVSVEGKYRLLERLEAAGVRAMDFWSVAHPSLPGERFPEARRRRATTVGLPVHQNLRDSDLDRIVETVEGWRRTD
jgi:dTDP-4-amino-4,6-dideoxygalactose transaminase